MEDRFKDISDNYDLDYYNSQSILTKSIDTINFVSEINDYFKEGQRKDFFEPLTFCNLLHKQLSGFIDTIKLGKPYLAVQNLKALNLKEEEKHILFGFILKWHGGYQVSRENFGGTTSHLNMLQYTSALTLLEREFLSFNKETPEKNYCLNKNIQTTIPKPLPPKAESYQYNKSDFEGYAFDNDWEHYYSGASEIGTNFIFEIVDYFEIGERKGLIEPLAFINLVDKCYKQIINNIDKVFATELYFKSLPFDETLKHILFGFIYYWISPNARLKNDINRYWIQHSKNAEKLFLSHNPLTPEKIKFGFQPELERLITELSSKLLITEKLNYWLEIKDNFKDLYPQTHLEIPDSIYNVHFKQYEREIAFGRWFLEFNSKNILGSYLRRDKIDEKLKSNNKNQIIAALNKIETFEKEAQSNLLQNNFDIYNYYDSSSVYKWQIEYLRLKDGYYDRHLFEEISTINSTTIQINAQYILIKEILETRLKELQTLEIEKPKPFELPAKDFSRAMDYYDEYVKILNLIESNPNKVFTIKEFQLEIPTLKDWFEEDLERNLYFLKNKNVIAIEVVSDYPIRKYKFKINVTNKEHLLKMTEDKIILDTDFTENEFYDFLKDTKSKTRQSEYDKLIQKIENDISGKITKSEKIYYFKNKRDELIKAVKQNKILIFYDILDLEKLASKLHFCQKYREKIPLIPEDPHSLFKDLVGSKAVLESILKSVFAHYFKIEILNKLIEKQENQQIIITEAQPNPEANQLQQSEGVKLHHREIALLYYYLGKPLNKNNAQEKAKYHGQSSGQKLMQHYNEIKDSELNITNHKFAVKNIEKVITLLDNNLQAKEKAQKDLKKAQTKK